MRLVNVSDPVYRILELSGLTGIMKVEKRKKPAASFAELNKAYREGKR